MDVKTLAITDVKLISPAKYADSRGFFMETFNAKQFADKAGVDVEFVQDNHSLSKETFTVRGFHYQSPPHAQGKLVRCTKGSILDVAVDIRKKSPTYGQFVTAELSDQNSAQLWIPAGFLHAFATLEPNTEVQYKCTDFYAPECDGNVHWNDHTINVDWPFDVSKAILSSKDEDAPDFASFTSPF